MTNDRMTNIERNPNDEFRISIQVDVVRAQRTLGTVSNGNDDDTIGLNREQRTVRRPRTQSKMHFAELEWKTFAFDCERMTLREMR